MRETVSLLHVEKGQLTRRTDAEAAPGKNRLPLFADTRLCIDDCLTACWLTELY